MKMAIKTDNDTRVNVMRQRAAETTALDEHEIRRAVFTPIGGIDNDHTAVCVVIYNPFDIESILATAIFARHRRMTKAVSILDYRPGEEKRVVIMGIQAKSDLRKALKIRAEIFFEVKKIDTFVDETGVGPSLLSSLHGEYGIRTEAYYKLFFHAQRFYNKNAYKGRADVGDLAFVWKNIKLALVALTTGEVFMPKAVTSQDVDDYLAEYQLAGRSVNYDHQVQNILDENTKVTICETSIASSNLILVRRIVEIAGYSFLNHVTDSRGRLVCTNLDNPRLSESEGNTLIIR